RVDAADVLRDVERERVVAERVAQARVGARPALVAGDVEAAGAAEAVGDDGVEVRGGGLLAAAHRCSPAERRSSARTKRSRSPSSTACALPTSTLVRWSLTIVYGCRT